MKITFLGTGTSQGIPVIACDCEVCTSSNPADKRLRVSVMIEAMGQVAIIDSGPDFRCQMLRAGVKRLDAIIFTHEHKDHIAGLDDVRAFNYRQQRPMDIYATARVQESLKREFYYAFEENKYPGVPSLQLHEIKNEPFFIGPLEVIPVEVMHYKLPVLGFRIGDFTYITDAKTVSEQERAKIRGSKVLVINALQKEQHISHFTYDEALRFAKEMGIQTTYFTHIGHRLGLHDIISADLPEGIRLAVDGLEIQL